MSDRSEFSGSKKKLRSVSIIIPAWNEETVLASTIEALGKLEYQKDVCEVVIVAGGHDNTNMEARNLCKDLLDFKRCIVLEQLPRGKNRAIQEGIQESEGEIWRFF